MRTVAVDLELETAGYAADAAKAAALTKGLGKEFEGLGTSADKFSTAKPTKEMQTFSRAIDGSLRDGMTAFEGIQKSIDDTKTRITSLRSELKTSQSSDTSSSIFGDLGKAQKDLRTLENIAKQIAPEIGKAFKAVAPEVGNDGQSAAKQFFAGIQKATPIFGNPAGIGIALGLVGAASPFIVAGLTAAIAAGVGGGFIAAAAIIQHNNPVLQSAFAQFKTDAVETGKLATSALVEPFDEALVSADRFVKSQGPALASLFADLAPAIRPLEADLEHMGATLLPALGKAAQGFTKAIASPEVTSSLQALDNQLAGLFNTIGNHPQEIADGFRTIFTIVNAGVAVVKGITEAYAAADGKLTQWHDDIQHWIDVQGGAQKVNSEFATSSDEVRQKEIDAAGGLDAYNKALAAMSQQTQISKGDFSSLATELGQTKITADTLAASLESRVFTTMMNSDMATLGWNQALTNLRATLKANKGVIDENVDSTIKHRQAAEADKGAILGAVSANQAIYQSMVASGISADDAAKAYDSNEKALRKQLLAAGLTKKQVDGLIGSYGKVPDKVNTVLAVKGLTDAINHLDTTLQLLNGINGFKAHASVTTTYYTKGRPHTGPLSQSYQRWGGAYEHADVGLVSAHYQPPTYPARYAYAEPSTGGEIFIPKRGDYGRNMALIGMAANWNNADVVPRGGRSGGATPVVVNLYASDPGGTALVTAIRLAVQDRGGDPIKTFTPRGSR